MRLESGPLIKTGEKEGVSLTAGDVNRLHGDLEQFAMSCNHEGMRV